MADKRVLVRADFNVPLESGKVLNDLRLRAAVPTIEFLHAQGASQIIIVSHLGRPEGKVVESLRMKPVEECLRSLTKAPFELRENLRFDPREEANDNEFAKELASLADIFVNEAFASCHDAHASIVGVPKLLPSYAGLRLMEEVEKLSEALEPPQGALAIIGGAKFETKEPLIKKLLNKYSNVLIGGALANDFIKARGLPFGSSLLSKVPIPSDVAQDERILIPSDAIYGEEGGTAERSGLVVDIRATESLIDIGPQTIAAWSKRVAEAPFVLWNGPLGFYERGYADGTQAIAEALARSGAKAVVGGGDTAAALGKFAFDADKVFVSTGGGAMLQFLSDGTLPGIEALTR